MNIWRLNIKALNLKTVWRFVLRNNHLHKQNLNLNRKVNASSMVGQILPMLGNTWTSAVQNKEGTKPKVEGCNNK
jgi:hypothetical protein